MPSGEQTTEEVTTRKEITHEEWCTRHKQRIDERRKMFALIRYYYVKEPYDLPADEIARLWTDLAWIRETQEEASKKHG